MVYYRYEYRVDGTNYVFIIESPTVIISLYRVTINDAFIGCLFQDGKEKNGTRWRGTTNALKPIVKKLGDLIDSIEEAVTLQV